MVDDGLLSKLSALVFTNLILECPVLSGNMRAHVDYASASRDEVMIVVSGPSYDLNEWRKNKRIILTNDFDYAASVNALGAFGGKSTKSKHWANKSVVNACKIIAAQNGAEVVVDVEL